MLMVWCLWGILGPSPVIPEAPTGCQCQATQKQDNFRPFPSPVECQEARNGPSRQQSSLGNFYYYLQAPHHGWGCTLNIHLAEEATTACIYRQCQVIFRLPTCLAVLYITIVRQQITDMWCLTTKGVNRIKVTLASMKGE